MENTKMGFGGKVKEAVRKMIVSLKHKPQTIPMVMMVITFLYYSLNLTHISDTTAAINRAPMGLCGFMVMLFSMLAFVCSMNAFPNRKPVHVPMLVLLFVMFAIIFASDVLYSNQIVIGVQEMQFSVDAATGKPCIPTSKAYLYDAWMNLRIHEILLGVTVGLYVLLPVYAKLLRKINTNIEVAAGQEMAAIEIGSED